MNITNILKKFNINKNKYTMFGKDCAKLKLNSKHCVKPANKKLILVTAISPTPSGEGKTTVAIGLNINAFGFEKNNLVKNAFIWLVIPP